MYILNAVNRTFVAEVERRSIHNRFLAEIVHGNVYVLVNNGGEFFRLMVFEMDFAFEKDLSNHTQILMSRTVHRIDLKENTLDEAKRKILGRDYDEKHFSKHN